MRRTSVLIYTIALFWLASTSIAASLTIGSGVDLEGPRIELLSSHADGLSIEFDLPALSVKEVTIDGETFQSVSIPGGGFIGELGEPEIPIFARLLAIPDRAGVEITTVIEETEELSGFRLLPKQGRDGEPFLYNGAAYQRNDFGSSPTASTGEPGIMRDLRIVPLTFEPVRYNPAQGVLRVARRVRVEVSFAGENSINAKNRPATAIAPSFHRLYQNLVVNYDQPAPEIGMAPGAYVVICPDNSQIISILQPLLDWRERQGYTVRLATTSETGTANTQIKSWLQNAYNTWEAPPEHIVLVGDATTPYRIQTWYENISYYNGEGDHNYVQLEGADVLADAHIGRLSFSTTTELQAIVNKILGYESTPELSDPEWYTRACLVGDPSSSGYSTVIVQQNIKERLVELGYTEIDTVYQSPFSSQMSTALNKGDSIFSYRGYLGMSGWQNSNSYALQNGFKMPFCVTITCDTGSFGDAVCRTEGLLRANAGADNPRGGIGAIGTATIGTHTRFNNAVHYGVFRGLLDEGQTTMGAALTRAKLEMYLQYIQGEPEEVEIWSYWNNLMGDSAVDVWTGYPESLDVDHPTTIATGANAATIQVLNGGLPEADARVCLLKDGETHAVGFTDAAGTIELPIAATTSGEMLLTVTKHNRHPYLATIPVAAEDVHVGYAANAIDDDSIGESNGNGDGLVNPGETIELSVQLRNFGIQNAPGVAAVLTSADPYVTILDANETFGDIAGGSLVWSGDDFDLAIDSSCPHGRLIRLGLDVTSGGDAWHSLIDLPVISADLIAESVILSNDGGNGLLDPGETVDMSVKIANQGGADAVDVTGVLSIQSSFVTITDNSGSWGTIPVDQSLLNDTDRFSVSASADTYAGYLATFDLVLSHSGGLSDTTTATLTVGERATSDPIGPDRYGYWAFDNTDSSYPEAPTYEWVEIDPNYGGSGTEVVLTDYGTYQDDSTVIDLPFPFLYYGESFTRATICSNGWLVMGSTWQVNYRNWTIPAAGGPDGILALLWDDHHLVGGGGVYQYHDAANHRYIVQWSRIRNEVNQPITIQMILYDPVFHPTASGDGIILFQYDTVANNNSGDNYATVGIESPDGRDGLLYSYYNRYPLGAATLASGRAIRFVPVLEEPSGILTGVVRNSFNNAPLADAEVTLVEAGRTFVTGTDGSYAGVAPAGTYTVTANHPGFETATAEDISISIGQQTDLDFDLIDNSGPIITTTNHPTTDDIDGPYVIPVTIDEYSGLPEKSLFWSIDGLNFTEVPLGGIGGNIFNAAIPGQDYIALVKYYVYAQDGLGQESFDPPGAPNELFSFLVAPTVELFADDMEADEGWTVGAPGDDASTGIWERTDPIGKFEGVEEVQPEDDHTDDPGSLCFVTDGSGGAQGDGDVDGGKTTLTSPLLDLTSFGTVTLRYYRWYTNDTGNAPGEDSWLVQVSNDDGDSWIDLENTSLSERVWKLMEFTLNDQIEMTESMRIRFVASDEGNGSIVEAAVDDVVILLTGLTVDAPETEAVPNRLALFPSRPNPSRAATAIAFSLAEEGEARLAIFDVQGRLVRTLVEGLQPAGVQSIGWDGRDASGRMISSGIYFYRLETGGRTLEAKLIRLD